MNPSILSGAIVCPLRILYIALFAAMVAMASPFTAGSSQVGNEPLAARYFDETLLGRNASVTERLLAPDARLITPEGTFIGLEGIDQFLATLDASFTDLVFVPEQYVVKNNQVLIHFTMTGVHTGVYRGLAPMCANVAVGGVATLQIGDSLITEQWLTYDRESLVAQIDGFHQLDPTNRPDCDAYTESRTSLAPTLAPERVPIPDNTPAHDANCVRRDRCDATS